MFQFKSWASSMRHLPVGRGSKSMNAAILTDKSFPSELRANPFFSKVSKLCEEFPGMWNTNRCGWSPMTKIDMYSIYSAQFRMGIWWWIGCADPACQTDLMSDESEGTNLLTGRLCLTAYLLFSQRFLYFPPIFICFPVLSAAVRGWFWHLKYLHRISLRSLGGA